jgi:hypothetical protein
MTSVHCNNCNDILHGVIPYCKVSSSVLNSMLVANILLLLFSYRHIEPIHLSWLFFTWLVLYSVAWVLSCLTSCRIHMIYHNNKHNRCDQSQKWHIIASQFQFSLLLTLFLWHSSVSPWIKGASLAISMSIVGMELLRREHYTSDIILTILITYLGFRAFCVQLK